VKKIDADYQFLIPSGQQSAKSHELLDFYFVAWFIREKSLAKYDYCPFFAAIFRHRMNRSEQFFEFLIVCKRRYRTDSIPKLNIP
jgi:hypothetical protein